jgi:Ca-activated chloride channel family protein
MPATAEAMSWHDLWQRPDQQAAQALRRGDAKQAQQLARDPVLRGAAAYRAGDYPGAAQALQQAPGSDAAYNLGNALARQSQYQRAIAAYDHALKLDPGNADAKANRQAVEDWLRKQQQKQPQDKQQQQDQQQSGQNGDKSQSSSDGQGKDNKTGKPQDQQSKQDAGRPSDQGGKNDPSQAQDRQGKDRSGKDQAGDQPKPLTPQQQAEQKAQTEQAQKALQQQMDQALAGKPKDQPGKAPHQLGAMAQDDPQSKLPADLRQALQRVPDDPGALLRRKFQLEYLQRHGGAPNEDDQP